MSEAYGNALILARSGYRLFASSRIFGPGTEDVATSDPVMLQAMHKIDPACVWMVAAGAEHGLLALSTPRARDLEFLIGDFGHFAPTLTIARENGATVRWFTCDPTADIKLDVALQHTHAKMRRNSVVPGSVHRSGSKYEILGGGPLDLERIARLPDSWIQALPKNTEGVTANLVTRYEYTPGRCSSY